jgi:protein SCO1/2
MRRALTIFAIVCVAVASPFARAQSKGLDPAIPQQAQGVDVEERIGLPLPMELTFTTSQGKTVRLGDYFPNGETRPAVIVLGYYRCPVVCGVLREKLIQTLRDIDYTAGKDYRLLVFTFDPGETPDSAHKYRGLDLLTYEREPSDADASFVYHTGDATSVRQLADALGYRYKLLGNGEYSHPVVVTLTTPQGKIGRYLYGFKQEPRDMRLALMETSEGKLVKSVGDRLLAFCYMFDPNKGSYTLQAVRVMQVGGIITLLCLAALVAVLLVGERMRRKPRLASVQVKQVAQQAQETIVATPRASGSGALSKDARVTA